MIEAVPTPWANVALVCRKCGKKLGGGFGAKGRTKLAKALRTELKATGRRRALRVVEVGCLGFCPKGAVTVVSSARPGMALAVPEGTPLAGLLPAIEGRDAA